MHRLDEQPTRHAVLGDITCDSDGKVDRFIDGGKQKRTLLLHDLRPNEPYQLAVFMVAYQEIQVTCTTCLVIPMPCMLMFTTAMQRCSRSSKATVREVLGYVQYEGRELVDKLQDAVEDALQHGHITNEQAGDTVSFYEQALAHYTYLSGRSE